MGGLYAVEISRTNANVSGDVAIAKMIVLLLDPVVFALWPHAGLDTAGGIRRKLARRLVIMANPKASLTRAQWPPVTPVVLERMRRVLQVHICPTLRLRHAGPMMAGCQPRRDPGVACSRFVRLCFMDETHQHTGDRPTTPTTRRAP